MEWSCSIVTLLTKGGDLSDPVDWRPISETNIFSKILEKKFHAKLLDYFLRNNILSDFQYGFLPKHSTHEAVYDVVKRVYSSLNNPKIMGMIFLDISKAFNCINHERLYKKFKYIGLTNRCIRWFRSYLKRTQKVRVSDKFSSSKNISSGIAQGTVLGPLMLIFFINDIIHSIRNCHISLFADDCVLYLDGNNWNLIHEKLQADLYAFQYWCIKNWSYGKSIKN